VVEVGDISDGKVILMRPPDGIGIETLILNVYTVLRLISVIVGVTVIALEDKMAAVVIVSEILLSLSIISDSVCVLVYTWIVVKGSVEGGFL
jgi:hypothetical protein